MCKLIFIIDIPRAKAHILLVFRTQTEGILMDISLLKKGDRVEVESRHGRVPATVVTTRGSAVVVRLEGENDNVRRYDDEIIRKL